jgi:Zn-dependent protease with chaperone function
MAMTQEQHDALIDRLEEYARSNPAAYKTRVALLAALGFAYLFCILALLLAILGILAYALLHGASLNYLIVKFGWGVGLLAYLIISALWVRFPPPEGIPLRREQVPRLFAMLDELSAVLQAPRFHNLLLTDDFNAGVIQRPRFGIFGWQENYLTLGLPLMQALSPEQFRAVIAHELGHLSGNHSRFGGWIYRVRKTWSQLWERLAQQKQSTFLFERFLNWYAPFFDAYSFVLARADEYEADRCAAQAVGKQHIADALINLRIQGTFLHRNFWPDVYKQADTQPEPPAAPYATLFQAFHTSAPQEEAARWLDQALMEKTDHRNTHPALKDRLSALGVLPRLADGSQTETDALPLPQPSAQNAAECYLADALPALTAQLDAAWRKQVGPAWQQRHTYARDSLSKLQALEARAQHETLTEEEAWDRARWTGEFYGNEAALPLLQELAAAYPDAARVHYALGQVLLEKEDAAGIAHIEKAMERELEFVLPGCETLYYFLRQQGKPEEARRYQERAEQYLFKLEQARQERETITARDTFLPHALPAETVADLRAQLARYPDIASAYLVRKAVTHFPERPRYVLAVFPRVAWYAYRSSDQDGQLAKRLASELKLSKQTIIFVINRYTKKLGKAIRRQEAALIYRR